MDGATLGDEQQSLPLSVVEVAGQLDVAVNMGDPGAARHAVSAVFRAEFVSAATSPDPLQWPALAIGVHPHRHRRTRTERGK